MSSRTDASCSHGEAPVPYHSMLETTRRFAVGVKQTPTLRGVDGKSTGASQHYLMEPTGQVGQPPLICSPLAAAHLLRSEGAIPEAARPGGLENKLWTLMRRTRLDKESSMTRVGRASVAVRKG